MLMTALHVALFPELNYKMLHHNLLICTLHKLILPLPPNQNIHISVYPHCLYFCGLDVVNFFFLKKYGPPSILQE